MKPKLVFLVMSAIHPVETVKELCRSLAPHTVLIHHDFAQNPDFALDEPNVVFVTDPKRTGWGVWGFTEGIFRGIEFAVGNLDFDYLQLLSPTCLPIKPVAAFEEHVAARRTDADFGWLDLYADNDALMSVGYRMFAQEDTLAYRILRRLFLIYFGGSAERRDVAGVQIRAHAPGTTSVGRLPLRARAALKATRAWVRASARRHIFDEDFRPYFGSAWFGAHRPVIEWLLERFRQPDIARQFSRLRIPEELLIATLLKSSGFRGGPLNHCIITFYGANPKWLDEGDWETLRASPAFFARKFPVQTDSSIRRRVLTELVGVNSTALVGTGSAAPIRPPGSTRPGERPPSDLHATAGGPPDRTCEELVPDRQ